jgi:uncharacterized protein with beta-barrel porin domain
MRIKPAPEKSEAGGCEPPTSSARRWGAIARRAAILLGGTAAIALSINQPASAISINDQVAAAAGGIANYYDAGNQFPYVASLVNAGGSFCTGSLINSRTILTAAHCFTPNESVSISFAPIAGPGTGITSFVRNSNFPGNVIFAPNDVAVISLAQPITTISPVPIAGPVPAPGTVLVSAGYGLNGTGTSCCNPIDNKRRNMTIEFGAYELAGTQPFLFAQFRNPQSPFNPNDFGLTVPTSTLEGGTAPGDSGGPLFVQTAAGLVQIGELQGGFNPHGPEGTYGDISFWTPLNLFLDWIAQNNPLRQVTAAAGNFNWSNSAAWIDSVPGVPSRVPDNTRGTVDINANEAARYYQVTLSNPGTITLDMNPQIDTLSIVGAPSQLVIGGPYTLEVLLGTLLSAGTLTMLPGGTLTTGFYTQTGGLLQFQLTPGGAGRITVTNTATLGGTLGVTVTPGLYGLSTQYMLLTAGAISGQFAQFISSPPPSSFLSLSGPFYTPTSVDVTVTRTPFNAVPGLTQNQRAVGNALETAYLTTLTGPAAMLYTNLLMTGTPEALTLLSGESATGAQTGAFKLMDQFLSIMLDPFVDGRAGVGGAYGRASAFAPDREPLPEDIALAYAKVLRAPVYKTTPFEQRWSIWGGAYGGYNKTGGDPVVVGSHDLTAHDAGFAVGMDYRLTRDTVVGFALAGGGTGWSLAQNLGTGSSDAFQAGVYGTTRYGPVYLAASLAYTQHWVTTDRYAFAGDHLTASFDAESLGARAETGYRLPTVFGAFTPYAAVQAQNFRTPTYNETDVNGGGSALTYEARDATDTRSELGARWDKQMLMNYGAVLALRARLAWAHDTVSDPTLAAAFQVLPGASFIVQGATPAKNSALTSAGAELRLASGLSVLAKFDGEFARGSQTYAGTGTVRYTW